MLVLVLDSKRISRSEACTSGNFEIKTGFHFRQPPQLFEHEDEHEHEKIHKDRSFLQDGTKGKASMLI